MKANALGCYNVAHCKTPKRDMSWDKLWPSPDISSYLQGHWARACGKVFKRFVSCISMIWWLFSSTFYWSLTYHKKTLGGTGISFQGFNFSLLCSTYLKEHYHLIWQRSMQTARSYILTSERWTANAWKFFSLRQCLSGRIVI